MTKCGKIKKQGVTGGGKRREQEIKNGGEPADQTDPEALYSD